MGKTNKKELVEKVAEKSFLTKKDAEAAIDALVETIKEELKAGNQVNISNFAIITPKNRKPREGTDPKTHERIEIPGIKTVSFKPSKALKDDLNR